MTFARRTAFLLLTGVTVCACLFDSSGFTSGGTPDGGAPVDVSNDSAASPMPDGAPTDAGADASFVHSAASTLWPTNGHYYEVVVADSIDWDTAREGADARGGHLATVTSNDENLFILYLVNQVQPPITGYQGPWIGGRQADGAVEPAGGWGWITGEPFNYTNWANGEPNDTVHNENVIGYINGATWADYQEFNGGPGYVVEYEP